MSLFSEHIKWKHAQPKVAGPFLLPIASFLNGVKNTHRKRQDRQLCPVCGRAKEIRKHRLLSQLNLTNFGVGVKKLKLKLLR